MRVQQEVGRHHDGGQHVVEVVGDAAGELADQLHLLRLVDWFCSARRSVVSSVDDRGLGLALVLLDRGDVEPRPALLAPPSIASTGAISPWPSAAWLIAAINGGGRGRRRRGRSTCWRRRRAEPLRQLREPRIGADHGAGAVDGRDRHRGVVEEAHEAHFGGALRSAPSSLARLITSVREAPGVPSAPKATL